MFPIGAMGARGIEHMSVLGYVDERELNMNDYYSPFGLVDWAPMVITDWRSLIGSKKVVQVGDRLRSYEMSWDYIDCADREAYFLGRLVRRAADDGLVPRGLLNYFCWTRSEPKRCIGLRSGSDTEIWVRMREVRRCLFAALDAGHEMTIEEKEVAEWIKARADWVRVYAESDRWQHLDTVAKHVGRSKATIERWRREGGSAIAVRGTGPNKQWDLWSVVDHANTLRANQRATQFSAA